MLKKFGEILVSREEGREAWLALQPLLRDLREGELIEVDFTGVAVFTPSWADEFITPLEKKFSGKVRLLPTKNISVQTTLKIIQED